MSKNVTRLTIFSAVCVLAAFSFTLLGLKSQAAPVRKPTPEPIWGAQILNHGNLYPMNWDEGHFYRSGTNNVRVTVQKSTTAGVVTRSTIHFFLYGTDPAQEWAGFQGVSLSEWSKAEIPGPAGFCGWWKRSVSIQ